MSKKHIAQDLAHAVKCREEAAKEQRAADDWRRMDRGRGLYADEIRICEEHRDNYLRLARGWDEQAVKDGWVAA